MIGIRFSTPSACLTICSSTQRRRRARLNANNAAEIIARQGIPCSIEAILSYCELADVPGMWSSDELVDPAPSPMKVENAGRERQRQQQLISEMKLDRGIGSMVLVEGSHCFIGNGLGRLTKPAIAREAWPSSRLRDARPASSPRARSAAHGPGTFGRRRVYQLNGIFSGARLGRTSRIDGRRNLLRDHPWHSARLGSRSDNRRDDDDRDARDVGLAHSVPSRTRSSASSVSFCAVTSPRRRR